MGAYYTGRGDDGTTGLLGDGRVNKDDPQPEAYGTVDEASAALGLARAVAVSPETSETILEIQRDLYALMAELAATPESAGRFRSIGSGRVAWLEARIDAFGSRVEMPSGFIVPGDTLGSAALDFARTVVRRAERAAARLLRAGRLANPDTLAYLNRLSSLCFVLELWEIACSRAGPPTLAKDAGA